MSAKPGSNTYCCTKGYSKKKSTQKLQINFLLLEILRTNLFHALGQSSAKGIK